MAMAVPIEGAKRVDSFTALPENIYVPGLDRHPITGKVEEVSPYQVKRLRLPLRPEMIASLKAEGHLQEVKVAKREDNGISWCELMDGVQRIRHGRQANMELMEKGLPPNLVRLEIVKNPDEFTRFAMMTTLNTLRTNASEEDNAEMAHWMLTAKHYQKGDVARWFGKTPQTIDAWLKDRGFSVEIKEEVANGTLEKTAARALAGMPREKAAKVLEVAKAEASKKNGSRKGHVSVRDVKNAAQRIDTGFSRPAMPEIVNALAKPDIPRPAFEVLAWITGTGPKPRFLKDKKETAAA